MSDYESAVFISYAWGGESEEIVNQIERGLQERGVKLIRDKRDLGYRGAINEFIGRSGQGNLVVVVISDKYLRSTNTMFELLEIVDARQFHERVFPIVLADANIFDPVKRVQYVKFWEDKRTELDEAIKTIGAANLQGVYDDIEAYDRIRDVISGLSSILRDMNTLTPDMHHDTDFSSLYDGIENQIRFGNRPGVEQPNAEDASNAPAVTEKAPDLQSAAGRRPERPAARFEYRHKGVDLAVAYTSKGWRLENIDGLFIVSSKIFSAPSGSFFRAILDDIPLEEERARLQEYLQKVADTLPEGENSVALPLPPELGQILLPFSRAGKAVVIAGMTSSPQAIDDEAQRETYAQTVIQKSVTFAGINGITHLVLPFVGDQTEAHVESTIQTLLGISDFGSLRSITLVTIHAPMAVVARNRFELLKAQQKNWQENNRAEAVSNDRARGEDQLNISGEVEALTDTLLLRDAEPPLAVGIIGGWGSGKSFVMHLIKERIKQTRAKAIKRGWPQPEPDPLAPNQPPRNDSAEPEMPAYAGHIYMIEFNAWTYAKSNLWASLMDTIFHTLSWQLEQENWLAHRDQFLEGEDPSPEEIHIPAEESMMAGGEIFKKIYEQGYQPDKKDNLTERQIMRLGGWSSKLLSKTLLWQAMRTQNEKTLENLRQNEQDLADLKIRRDILEKKQTGHGAYLAQIMSPAESKEAYNELLKSSLHDFFADTFGKSFEKALKQKDLDQSEVEEVKDLMQGYKGLFAAFRQNKYYFFAAAGVAAISIALPILYEMSGKQWVDYGITWFTTILSVVAPVLQAIRTQAHKVLEFEQETRKALENTYIAHRRHEAELILADSSKTTEEKIHALDEKAKKGSLPAYDAQIALREAQVEQQRQQLGPSVKYPTLLEFVQSRLNAATYENQLGLMHQVRKDCDELTYSLVTKANQQMFPRGKPRVILFIDDLDRCPPSRVVEILETVQLLLNTELFIVVLGLDTRYVTRALEKEYKEILQSEGDPSGLDYIEKIIQIPYRVRPIEDDGLRKYLEGQMKVKLLGKAVASQEDALQSRAASQSTIAAATSQSNSAKGAGGTQPSAENPEQGPEESLPRELLEFKSIELPAAVIKFKPEDIADLNDCCQKISLSPRSIKRLVNVLKLMKIFWFRTAKSTVAVEEREPSRLAKQAAIILLALSSAYPEVMRQAFVHIETLYRQGKHNTQLFAALEDVKLPPNSLHEIIGQLVQYKSDLKILQKLPGIDKKHHYGYITLKDLSQSTFNLTRSFSFVGDPVYWSDAEEAPRSHRPKPQTAKIKIGKNGK